jgi:hypothetical protein
MIAVIGPFEDEEAMMGIDAPKKGTDPAAKCAATRPEGAAYYTETARLQARVCWFMRAAVR